VLDVGLEEAGRMIMGVVYDPIREELFYAESGHGAFLNNKRISVSGTGRLSESFLATGFSYGKREKGKNIKHFSRFLMASLAVRRAGSAALDLCYVACGRFDGFWEMNLHPWDCAAGVLIVRESNGMVTKFDGSSFTPYDKAVLATNGSIHRQMVKILSR